MLATQLKQYSDIFIKLAHISTKHRGWKLETNTLKPRVKHGIMLARKRFRKKKVGEKVETVGKFWCQHRGRNTLQGAITYPTWGSSENHQECLFLGWYCWWLKSCTTWDVQNLINNGINYLSTGAGFHPSTSYVSSQQGSWFQNLDYPGLVLSLFYLTRLERLSLPNATSGRNCPNHLGNLQLFRIRLLHGGTRNLPLLRETSNVLEDELWKWKKWGKKILAWKMLENSTSSFQSGCRP